MNVLQVVTLVRRWFALHVLWGIDFRVTNVSCVILLVRNVRLLPTFAPSASQVNIWSMAHVYHANKAAYLVLMAFVRDVPEATIPMPTPASHAHLHVSNVMVMTVSLALLAMLWIVDSVLAA
jgi:hypothetical protein